MNPVAHGLKQMHEIADRAHREVQSLLENIAMNQLKTTIEDCARDLWNLCNGSVYHIARRLDKVAEELEAKPVSEENARFAIEAAIAHGRKETNKPPTEDHWLMPYWKLGQALQYYADGHHFDQHDPTAWDTVSGEPANFQEDEACTATVEDGSIAKLALKALDDAPAKETPA